MSEIEKLVIFKTPKELEETKKELEENIAYHRIKIRFGREQLVCN